MRLYSQVDLTSNVNTIEKLILGGTGTRDPPKTTLMKNHLKTFLEYKQPQIAKKIQCPTLMQVRNKFLTIALFSQMHCLYLLLRDLLNLFYVSF